MAERTVSSSVAWWRDMRSILPLGVAAVAVLAAVVYVSDVRGRSQILPQDAYSHLGQDTRSNENRAVSKLEFPAKLLMHVGLKSEGQGQPSFNQPSAILPVGDMYYYVLDAGNGRIVQLDHSGAIKKALDSSTDQQLALHLPMSMAVDKDKIVVADSGSSRIVEMEPVVGKVDRVIALSTFGGDAEPPRPIGIAVNQQGDIFVSDANNQRVLKYTASGRLINFVGTGKRENGQYGLNSPGGLALDREDNLYVVDILNSRVIKYSSDGKFLLQIGGPGDTAGLFSRPKGVAVDDNGDIFVTDSLQAAIQVFDAQGKYVGLIGRKEAGNENSDSMFESPAELQVVAGRLYVTDRTAGLFVFELKD